MKRAPTDELEYHDVDPTPLLLVSPARIYLGAFGTSGPQRTESLCTLLIQGMCYSGLTLFSVCSSAKQHLDFAKCLIIVWHETKTSSHGLSHAKLKPYLPTKIKLAELQHLYLPPRAENTHCSRRHRQCGWGRNCSRGTLQWYVDENLLHVLQSSGHVPTSVTTILLTIYCTLRVTHMRLYEGWPLTQGGSWGWGCGGVSWAQCHCLEERQQCVRRGHTFFPPVRRARAQLTKPDACDLWKLDTMCSDIRNESPMQPNGAERRLNKQ